MARRKVDFIKNVIIYLRKSRGDEENALEKHRTRLVTYCESKGWNFSIMEEDIVSGERLITRPIMLEILDILEEKDCIYDGVLVVDYDRLSRGGSKDFGSIIEVFQFADKYIITPDKIYDTNDQNDLTMLGIQGIFAHNELRKIVTRFVDGKKDGAMLGKWTNGKPPYPYEYVKKIEINDKGKEVITGDVVINDDKLQVYNRIKNLYINKRIGTEEISFTLNREGIPSPGGKTWSNTAVARLLTHEFHLGKVIYGKNEWKKNRENKVVRKKKDESQWVVGEGKHIPVKTQDEHEKILEIMGKNQKVPRRSRQGVFPTTGLMYCKKCNRRMIYSVKPSTTNSSEIDGYTRCYYRTPIGEKCTQIGIKMDNSFYDNLFNAIISKHLSDSYLENQKAKSIDSQFNKKRLEKKQKEIEKLSKALLKSREAYEAGIDDLGEYSSRKKDLTSQLEKVQEEIAAIEKEINAKPEINKIDLHARLDEFNRIWHSTKSSSELNKLLKKVVKKIYYNRNGDEVTFDIEYC